MRLFTSLLILLAGIIHSPAPGVNIAIIAPPVSAPCVGAPAQPNPPTGLAGFGSLPDLNISGCAQWNVDAYAPASYPTCGVSHEVYFGYNDATAATLLSHENWALSEGVGTDPQGAGEWYFRTIAWNAGRTASNVSTIVNVSAQ